MAYKGGRPKGARNAKQSTSLITASAPKMGMDARNPLAMAGTDTCLYAYNLVPSEYGLSVRKGYREWQVGIGFPVRTVMPFNSSDPAKDRMFVATSDGIFDCSVPHSTPKLMTTSSNWVLNGADAGWGTFVTYVSGAGDTYMFYADSINGLFRYTDATDTWEVPTDITDVDIGNINFVTIHKLRIWVCVVNDGYGYYLPQDSIAGAAEKFGFGSKFTHGGDLKGLYNWTVDGGAGVDDYLVAISTSGDVLPYRGADPKDTSWAVAGSYYIGETVRGTRCASQQGGNLHILSSMGLVSMSDLLRGVDPRSSNAESISSSVAPYLRALTKANINKHGWAVLELPTEGVIIITTPTTPDGDSLEFVYSVANRGWGLWRDVPIISINDWHEIAFIGTEDGRVLAMNSVKDNVKITPVAGEENGDDINFSVLLNYNSLNADGLSKRGVMLRPDFSSSSPVAVESKFMYDFDLGEILSTPKAVDGDGTKWDLSKWDAVVWSSTARSTRTSIVGGVGMGRVLSLALKGKARSGAILASVDVFYNVGGAL